MPTQEYECPKCHITFDVTIPTHAKVPRALQCPNGQHYGYWRPSAPYFIVEGGTGAGKESHHR